MKKNVLIIEVTMFLDEKLRNWFWQVSLFMILALFLQSCGVPESKKTAKENDVTAGEAGVAYKKEVTNKDDQEGVKTESATFALG